MKKILVLGASGMVGSRFVDLMGGDVRPLVPDLNELDITDKSSVDSYFKKNKEIETVVNFAAYTNVGEAENQKGDKKGLCWKLNVDAVGNVASNITPQMHLVHISTDMVFPGSKENPGPYIETQNPETDSKKVTWYGFTKGEAERVIREELGSKATILRIIYPVRSSFEDKQDYLRGPLKLFDEGKLYPMFSDQQVSIAYIDEIAQALNKIIDGKKYGTFHASSTDTGSPHKIVSYLIEKVRGKKNAVKKSSLDEFLKKVDNPVRYPKFGGLSVVKTQKELGIKFSTWKEIIDKLVEQGIGR